MNEPVFPQDGPGEGDRYRREGGMTLRDYMATQIAAQLVHTMQDPEETAEEAYKWADALLKEREKNAETESA